MAREIREDIDKIFDQDKEQRSEHDKMTPGLAVMSLTEAQPTDGNSNLASDSSSVSRRPAKGNDAHNPVAAALPTPKCTQILKDFAYEVGAWRKLSVKQPTPGRFAAYLTDKYFVKLLKPLPDSKLVKVAKQAIATEIEKISSMENKGSRGQESSAVRQPSQTSKAKGSRRQSLEERRKWNMQQTQRSRMGKGTTYGSPSGGVTTASQRQNVEASMPHLEIPPRQYSSSNQFQSVEDLIKRAEQQEDSLRNLRAQGMDATSS